MMIHRMHHIQYIALKTGDTQNEKAEIYKPGKKNFFTQICSSDLEHLSNVIELKNIMFCFI